MYIHRQVFPRQIAKGQNIYYRKFKEIHNVTTQYSWTFDGPGHLTAPQNRDTFNRYRYAESAQYSHPNLIMNRAFLVVVRCGFKTSNMNILRSGMIVLHVNKRANVLWLTGT